ncbi:hypothetical protein [Limnoglobus roseus]|uniref:Uncharacterized protein n=1 Tax=Limnoglobus roseus TaxID=2598579 RepID=A0A5C1AHT7_9BACT|nr:hypothetical protein [Limnoglobus roseus]QEL16694.1 hypothetical protein PX52LOC_03657 [Limnoglobus roseus]
MIARPEPWPEVLTRPWPDGVAGLPWLPWLMGHKRLTSQSRLVVRKEDGRPVLYLHERLPIFRQTVGIFNADDVRVGYCGGGFKGGAGINVSDTAHKVIGTLMGDNSSLRLVGDKSLGEIKRTKRGFAVTCERPDASHYLLAVTLVLMLWGRT